MKAKTKTTGKKTAVRATKGGYHRSVYAKDADGNLHRYATMDVMRQEGFEQITAQEHMKLAAQGARRFDKRAQNPVTVVKRAAEAISVEPANVNQAAEFAAFMAAAWQTFQGARNAGVPVVHIPQRAARPNAH